MNPIPVAPILFGPRSYPVAPVSDPSLVNEQRFWEIHEALRVAPLNSDRGVRLIREAIAEAVSKAVASVEAERVRLEKLCKQRGTTIKRLRKKHETSR